MQKRPSVQTIFSPALFHLYEEGVQEKNVVVIDILRATTTMVLAFENGALEIVPVGIPEEAMYYKNKNFLVAAERGGETVEGFALGNSPQDYTREVVQGKRIAITTTNGTNALRCAAYANKVIVGAFLNIHAIVKFLKEQNRDTLLFCAGWKNKCNLEDAVFAGALVDYLKADFRIDDDSSHIALDLWNLAKGNIHEYLGKASHSQRFKTLHIESDLDICLQMGISNMLPIYEHGSIVLQGSDRRGKI